MVEEIRTFLWFDRFKEPPDLFLNSRNSAFPSFAKQSLQLRKHHFNRIEIEANRQVKGLIEKISTFE